MKYVMPVVLTFLLAAVPAAAEDEDFSYDAIAKRFSDTQLSAEEVRSAKMHGECMVGLKRLIFVKRDHFDPVAEWVNYRTFSLLEQFPPCEVLIMMRVARDELMGDEPESD